MSARRRYELVRAGCATGSADCPHGAHAVTAHELRPDGRRRWEHLTVCIDGRELELDEASKLSTI